MKITDWAIRLLSGTAVALGAALALHPVLSGPQAPAARVITASPFLAETGQAQQHDTVALDQAKVTDAKAVLAAQQAAAAAAAQAAQEKAAQSPPQTQAESYPVTPLVYSAAQIGQFWLDEGGSSSTESDAICIAEHESGGNTNAISYTNDTGIWQINVAHDPGLSWVAWVLYMQNPLSNAHYAIMLSADGTTWSAWTTAPDCGL